MLNITNTCLYQACTNITTYHHKICVSTKYQPVNHASSAPTMHQTCTINHVPCMHQPCTKHVHAHVHHVPYHVPPCASTMYICINHVPYHVPTMYINHVHQHHTIYHKISSMKCLNHMPRICAKCVPSIYQDHQQVPLSMYQYQ
jgi:hypothetical protein